MGRKGRRRKSSNVPGNEPQRRNNGRVRGHPRGLNPVALLQSLTKVEALLRGLYLRMEGGGGGFPTLLAYSTTDCRTPLPPRLL